MKALTHPQLQGVVKYYAKVFIKAGSITEEVGTNGGDDDAASVVSSSSSILPLHKLKHLQLSVGAISSYNNFNDTPCIGRDNNNNNNHRDNIQSTSDDG